MNPYVNYYNSQVGSGLAGFQGLRYQKGHGWFGRLFSNVVFPLEKQVIPALGKQALPSGIALAHDILAGENVGRSAIKRLKEAGRNIAHEGVDIVRSKLFQSGSCGKRFVKFTTKRKRGKSKPRVNKKKRKTTKQPDYLK